MKHKKNTADMGRKKKKRPATDDDDVFLLLVLPLRNPCGVTLMLSLEHTTPHLISALISYCLNSCTLFLSERKALRREETDTLILLQNKTKQKMIHSLREPTLF